MLHYNTTETVTSKMALVANLYIPQTDDTAERPRINADVRPTCMSIQKWMVPKLVGLPRCGPTFFYAGHKSHTGHCFQ